MERLSKTGEANFLRLISGFIFGVIVFSGIVVALNGVAFLIPITYQNVSGDLTIDWDNLNSTPGLFLQYNAGNCLAGPNWTTLNGQFIDSSITTFDWDTTTVADGIYCLRLFEGVTEYANTGNFTIDNTDPLADAGQDHTQILLKEVTLDASNSSDNESGIALYIWDFGDGNITNTTNSIITHLYTATGNYDVSLTVIDYAGNSDSDNSVNVQINDLPTVALADQEVLAFDDFMFTFDSGLVSLSSCEILSPSSPGIGITTSSDNCTLNLSTTNDLRGSYNIVVKAVNATSEMYYSFTLTIYSWMIPLEAGWNLVSIPLVADDNSIDDVLIDRIDDNLGSMTYPIWSYQYDGADSVWLKSRTSSTSRTLHTVNPGYAYWINMDAPDVLKGFGSKTGPATVTPPEVEVPFNNWVLIGRYGIVDNTALSGPVDVMTALTSLFRTNNETVYSYTTSTDSYDLVTMLHPQKGYWAFLSDPDHDEGTYAPVDGIYDLN